MRQTRTAGFTLVELMVTIAIVAILLAIGLPSFQGSLRSNRVATATNEMLAGISLARTEAIKNTHAAQICARDDNDPSTCGDDWTQGWLVMADTDGDDDFETLVKASDPRPDLLITMTGAADNTVVTFDNRGRTTDAYGAEREIEISPDAEDASEAHYRCMTLKFVGQVTTEKGACEA